MDLKFRIKNKHHSETIQKRLFGMGYNWAVSDTAVSNTEMPGLYTDGSRMSISYSDADYFDQDSLDKTTNFIEALLVHPKQLKFLKKLLKPCEIVLNIIDTKFYLKRDTPYLNKLLN